MRFIIALVLLLASSAGVCHAQPATKPSMTGSPIIILKLDDVVHFISPRWIRVADYLEQKKIHASMGIIGESLEKIQPEAVKWINDHRQSGMVEFWLHGYTRTPADKNKGEFQQGTTSEQLAILTRVEALAREKLGFEFAAFGPHWTGTNDQTEQALQAAPQIQIWLYGPKQPTYFKKLSLPRIMALENPTFVPDFEKFKDTYEKYGRRQPVLVLQGHPDQWADANRWEGFVQIIEFLQAQGCRFMTPTEYQQSLAAPVK